MLYLGSNQNGYFYLCKKCNTVIPTNNGDIYDRQDSQL